MTYYDKEHVDEAYLKLLQESVYEHDGESWYDGVSALYHELEKFATTELPEVPTAHRGLHLGLMHYCSNCGKLSYMYKYCTTCGAKVVDGDNK